MFVISKIQAWQIGLFMEHGYQMYDRKVKRKEKIKEEKKLKKKEYLVYIHTSNVCV